MGSASKNKKISLLNIFIDFFAYIYDLGYNFIKLSVRFFASLYDMVYNSFTFLWEYLKWITDMSPAKTKNFTKKTEEPITRKPQEKQLFEEHCSN